MPIARYVPAAGTEYFSAAGQTAHHASPRLQRGHNSAPPRADGNRGRAVHIGGVDASI